MSRYLIKLPQFLKPFFIELKDTTIFILSDIFNYIDIENNLLLKLKNEQIPN